MIGRQVARFYVIRSIGSGGMGLVYEAQDTRLPRSVAIKFLKPALARHTEAVRRFRREARLASLLNHPNICTILDVDEADGQAFIAMELLQGRSLKQRLTGPAMSLDEIVDVAVQITRALAAAHEQGIMHRDITPGNIFLTNTGMVKLLDFGLAKQFAAFEGDEGSTTAGVPDTGAIVGTVHYMAPELFRRGSVPDGRCDLYALGAVLYQMACGQRPFEAPSKEDVIALILSRPHIPLRRLAPHHPAELEHIVDALLSKDPDGRPQSATDLRAALERLLPQMSSTRASQTSVAPARAIAVLPFRVLGAGDDAAAIGEGIAEDIAAHLSRNRNLRIAPRTSTRHVGTASIREIGQRLAVPLLVEGSVQQDERSMRVIANIVQTLDERPIAPAIIVSRQSTHRLETQNDLAADIAAHISAALPADEGRRPTMDAEAFHAFRRGQHHWQHRFSGGWQPAIEEFQYAVERDPQFALAHIALASAYEFLGFYTIMKPALAFSVAQRSIEAALELDESSAVAHTELALIRFGGDWDWDGAERAFRRAIELEPANATAHVCYSWLLTLLGREETAFAEAEIGHQLAPRSRFVSCCRAQTLFLARRFEETIELCNRCLAEAPDYVFAVSLRGQCFQLTGRFDQAVVDLERAATITQRMPFYVGMLGNCYGMAGMRVEALDILSELDRAKKTAYVPPQCYVYAYAGLGDRAKALQYQEEAYVDGASPFNYFAPSIRDLYALDPLHKKRLEQMRLVL